MGTLDEVVFRCFRRLQSGARWPASSDDVAESTIAILLSDALLSRETRAYAAGCVDGWRRLVWMPKRERDKLITKLRTAEVDAAKRAIVDMILARSTLLPREND